MRVSLCVPYSWLNRWNNTHLLAHTRPCITLPCKGKQLGRSSVHGIPALLLGTVLSTIFPCSSLGPLVISFVDTLCYAVCMVVGCACVCLSVCFTCVLTCVWRACVHACVPDYSKQKRNLLLLIIELPRGHTNN